MLIEIEDDLIRRVVGDDLPADVTDDSGNDIVTPAVNKLLEAQLDLAQKSDLSDSDKPRPIGKCSVAWVIDIEEAVDPTDAASQALKAQRKGSIATVFVVTADRDGRVWEVDLDAVEGRSTEKLLYEGH
jgi:hypothetical protein